MTDPGYPPHGVSCSGCRWRGMDMDMDPYCAAPQIVESNRFGLNCNVARLDKEGPCGPTGKLFEVKE